MLLLLSFFLLAQEPAPAPEPSQETPASPQPLLLVEMPQPGVTAEKLLSGPLQQKLMASPLWSALQSVPGYPAVQVGWDSLLAPAGGDARLFVESVGGDGIHAFLIASGEGEPQWLVVAQGHDGDLAQDCLAPLLGLAGISRKQMRGERWTVALGKIHLRRSDDRFLAAEHVELLDQMEQGDLADALTQPQALAFPDSSTADMRGWMAGDLLRADGYEALPEDAGASYLAGEIHEVLRLADWVGMDLRLEGHTVSLAFAAPAGEQLRESHAPYFPEIQEVPVPQLAEGIMEGIFTRDLAHWWAARSLYMSARGVAETVEGESTAALLFGRDPGSEVYLYLESEMRFVAAALPEDEAANLSVEYPAGAVGLRFKDDAPEDLGSAFTNAFFAGITFANFEGGAMGDSTLQMDILPLDNGRIYAASYPAPAEGQKASQRHNFSPSLLLRDDGELWLSSSLGLLQEIAAAPVKMVPANGMWMDFRMPDMAKILRRDRSLLVANRMLEEGGDLEAAAAFIDLVLTSLDLVEGAAFHSFLEGDFMRLELQLRVSP